ncbi:hypothetical protein AB0A60_21815 [Streptomyces sp. NPDC046275]|uniref:hypothetical protein n=1 Tax=Streptomyces sp. NPDC046275 TaxID=3157201 RepID=UPI0033DCB2FF
MRFTRRTLRTAAVATGTIAALALPAAAAFADDQPAPAPSPDSQSQDQDQGQGQGQSQDQGQGQGDQGPVVGRVFLQSYRLADGSVARVYLTTPTDYQAEIWAGGTLLDTLRTSGQPAYGQNNGLHVVLQPDGTVSSWMDQVPTPKPDPKPTPKPKPAPQPKPKPAVLPKAKLADGTVATFAKTAKNGPRVEVTAVNGKRLATVDPRHLTVRHHGWTYKLAVQPGRNHYRFVVIDTPRKGGNSWVYDLNGKLVAKYHAQKH